MITMNSTTTDQATNIEFFSFAVLPPVCKPRPVHAQSASSALIGRLIEETLNPTARKATQTMVLGKTRQLLLSISVSKPTEGKNAAMLLQLPHGLFNPAGVTLGIDGAKPETLVIQTCDARGCYAGAPITPEKLSAMRAGAKLNVTFQILKKQKIVVPVPLKGFAEAYKKL